MADTLTLVLSRSIDRRSWIATRVYDGRAVGIGPTPARAVDELCRWAPWMLGDDAPQPEGG